MNESSVDLAAWIKRFPLDEYLPKMWRFDTVFTPLDWAIIEQIRERAAKRGDLGKSRPTDSLVFIRGEGPRRNITKVGGAPYRPSGEPWPRGEDGGPLTFVAQFSFTESKDIVGELPGEMLLIFIRENDLYLGDPPCLYCEWQPPGLTNLIDPNDVPPPAWVFANCHAVRRRTVDFEDELMVAKQIRAMGSFAHMHPGCVAAAIRSVARLPSAKIGGLPHWMYPQYHEGPERDGPILCALSDLTYGTDVAPPAPEVDWWADDDDIGADHPEEYLDWNSDGVQLNFFLGEQGRVTWSCDGGSAMSIDWRPK